MSTCQPEITHNFSQAAKLLTVCKNIMKTIKVPALSELVSLKAERG